MQDLFIEFLPPWVETGLQPAFYDRESGTVLQQTARMYAKVNELVKAVNGMDKVIKEYVDYIDNYFKNLDVQEEINNKLDAMAEGGELETYIAQFLATSPVFAFATISDMASATNLANGSIARVIGNSSAYNGDGAYYMIRTKQSGESADGVQKVAIGDSLIGDRIANNTVKKYLFVGDSYADGWTPDGDVTPWQDIVKTKLNLSDSQFVTTHLGGVGFARQAPYNFYTIISNLDDDPNITDIVIGGGYNDIGYSYNAILASMRDVVTLCNTKFPNAKIHIAFIGWSKNAQAKSSLIYTYHDYNYCCDQIPQIDFLQNTQYALRDYFYVFSSDGIHPNLQGEYAIANAVYDALVYGQANIAIATTMQFTPVNSGEITGSPSFNTYVNNGVTSLWNGDQMEITWTEGNYPVMTGTNEMELATITNGAIIGLLGNGVSTNITAVAEIDTETSTAPFDGRYITLNCQLLIREGKIWLNGKLVNQDGTNYGSYTIKQIQFPTFSLTINTMLA